MLSIKRPRLLQVFLYLSLVSSTSFIVRSHFASSQNDWLVWSALIFSLALLPYRRCKIISLLSVASIIFILPAAFLASSFWLMLAYLLVITALMVFLGEAYKKHYLLLFVVNLFSILSASFALDLVANRQRLFFVVIGTSIALIWQIIFLPKFTKYELQYETQIALDQLKGLAIEIFSCFLQPAYSDNIYLFERRLHQQKEKFFCSMNKIHKITRFDTAQPGESKLIIFKLNQLFDILLSIAQLRRRVSDYTIFSVCKQDMLALSEVIENQLVALTKAHNDKLPQEKAHGFMETIRQFEATYQSVLQVTAQEPLVFLLFIFDLKNLSGLMEGFNHDEYVSLKASNSDD